VRRLEILLLSLILVSLACQIQVPGAVTPSSSPTPPPSASPSPVPTLTATPRATEAAADTVAIVRQVSVNVRDEADGVPTGEYIYAGQEVTILEIDGDWVRIADPAGWVYIGCLENLSEKGCTAK
jgi:hypothetical protein